LVRLQIGDRVDSLGEAPRFVETAPTATDLDRLCRMGKLDAGGDGQDLQGADLPTAVPTVGVPVGFRCLSPEQTGQLLVQDGLVAFDGQDPVRAAVGEIGDVVTLADQSHRRFGWWARLGSNQRPPACKAGALPLSYAPVATRPAHATPHAPHPAQE
jgi:hypothetical protein